ncbi:tyrosine type site-specific recombinase [Flammeovirgaceae bacterium 311]|nr:tyrosine type site-specific recombinase [Flammeovirgaceae bacterium 311]
MQHNPNNYKEAIEKQLLDLFEESIGWEFRVKGQKNELRDIVEGVNHDFKMVRGRKYGAFPVAYCELTGKGPQDLEGGQQ